MSKLTDDVATAGRAQQLLDNKEFTTAVEIVEKRYLEALLAADPTDDMGRFRLAEAIRVVRMVVRHLQIVVEGGKLSKATLEAMTGGKSRF